MVFKLNSWWPETRVCCPKTLCSGHLQNEGLRSESKGLSTSSLPSLCRVDKGARPFSESSGFELFEFLLKGIVGECVTTRSKSIKASPSRVYVYLSRATHAQQTTAMKSHSCFELV